MQSETITHTTQCPRIGCMSNVDGECKKKDKVLSYVNENEGTLTCENYITKTQREEYCKDLDDISKELVHICETCPAYGSFCASNSGLRCETIVRIFGEDGKNE